MKFADLQLHDDLMRGINEIGFSEPTDVQQVTFEKTLGGTDVYVQSQTGTGKTAAYLISIFQLIRGGGKFKNAKALIIVPTRELAVQVEQEAQRIGKYCNIKTGSFYGGMGYAKQEDALKEDLDLYIGTPGRLIDFCKTKKIDFKKMNMLVIDEADRMFDMGFLPDIRFIVKKMPVPTERLTMLYSATLNMKVRQLAWEYMNEPFEIEISPEQMTVENVTQCLYHVGSDEKMKLLLGILKKESPRSVVVFTNTKHMAEEVSRRLEMNGYKNEFISGDLPQKKRLRIIDDIKEGKTEFLVATDVAARGLHIDDLDLVVNYDIPQDAESYVHRVGRTARAGKSGKAIALACEKFVYNLEAIEKLIGMSIPVAFADETMYAEDKSAGIRISTHRDETHRGSRPPRRGDAPPRRGGEGNARRSGGSGGTQRRGGNRNDRDDEVRRPVKKIMLSREFKTETPVEEKPKRNEALAARPPKQAHRKNDQKKYINKKQSAPNVLRPKKDGSIEDRLEYYRQKYGEDFVVADKDTKTGSSEKPQGGLLGKIRSLLKK